MANLATPRWLTPETEQGNLRLGMTLMVAAMLFIPGMDAIAKYLSAWIPPAQIAWSRFFFQSIFLIPIVLYIGSWRGPRRIGLQAARGILIALATFMFFTSLRVLRLPDAIAIFFVAPLFLTLWASIFLKEPIGWRRIASVIAGFIGALIIIRPTFAVFGWVALLPVGTAIAFSFYLLLTRMLATTGSALTTQMYAGIFGGLTMTAFIAAASTAGWKEFVPVWPETWQWAYLAGLGVIATGAHLLVVLAFKLASASTLAPFQYLEIVAATALGYVVFGNFPDAQTWLGIAIIVAAGLYVFHREQRT